VAGAVNASEKAQIVRALDQSGWNQSTGIRRVLLAFVESASVRDAVFDHIRGKRHAA